MKIRSVTCFVNVDETLGGEELRVAGELGAAARELYPQAGFPVQTVRLATQPLNAFIKTREQLLPFARELERACSAQGLDFKGLGAIEGAARDSDLNLLDGIVDVIGATENVFAAVQVATRVDGINLRAVHATARAMRALADTSPEGMGNFRFAALANVPAGAPFFPAAFAGKSKPSFSIATEAADLAVRAFTQTENLDHARTRLVRELERAGEAIARVSQKLARQFRWKFNGIDFTLAPYHELEASLGTAMERLTGNQFGERTTLFAAAFVTDCLRRAKFPRTGFSGIFLPVLEDGVVAARSHTQNFSIDSLLLYSAVCGTGLDNIPLPADASADALAAILLDLATLAVKLDKPLTARLLPIPNTRAGDSTHFDFPWFTNARVMETRGALRRDWADANDWLEFKK